MRPLNTKSSKLSVPVTKADGLKTALALTSKRAKKEFGVDVPPGEIAAWALRRQIDSFWAIVEEEMGARFARVAARGAE
jgi:hypothetical protein